MRRSFTPRTKLHRMLEEIRMSQKMLAEIMNVDPPTVSAWMSGRRIPQAASMERLAQVLQRDPDYVEGLFVAQNIVFNHRKPVCKWISAHLYDLVQEGAQDAE